jgi:hypothetical protein
MSIPLFLRTNIAFCMMISSGVLVLYVLYAPLMIVYNIANKNHISKYTK